MTSNQPPINPIDAPCHLLSLPPELRQTIYALVFGNKRLVVSPIYTSLHPPLMDHAVLCAYELPYDELRPESTRVHHPLSLTQTCRRIRAETEALPFALNSIHHRGPYSRRIRLGGRFTNGDTSVDSFLDEQMRYGPLYGLLERLSDVQRCSIRSIRLDYYFAWELKRRLGPDFADADASVPTTSGDDSSDTMDVDEEDITGPVPNWSLPHVHLPGLKTLVIPYITRCNGPPLLYQMYHWEKAVVGAFMWLGREEISAEEVRARYGFDKAKMLGLAAIHPRINWTEWEIVI